jgi:hypothetical protein
MRRLSDEYSKQTQRVSAKLATIAPELLAGAFSAW